MNTHIPEENQSDSHVDITDSSKVGFISHSVEDNSDSFETQESPLNAHITEENQCNNHMDITDSQRVAPVSCSAEDVSDSFKADENESNAHNIEKNQSNNHITDQSQRLGRKKKKKQKKKNDTQQCHPEPPNSQKYVQPFFTKIIRNRRMN